jgi:hypothetical protein
MGEVLVDGRFFASETELIRGDRRTQLGTRCDTAAHFAINAFGKEAVRPALGKALHRHGIATIQHPDPRSHISQSSALAPVRMSFP